MADYRPTWYVLGGLEATKVAAHVLPLDEDWWHEEPFDLW